MRRCESWPQLFVLPAEKEVITEVDEDNNNTLDSLLQKEAECDELQNEVANYEIQFNDLANRAEQIEEENQFLNKENVRLKEESIANAERIKFLDQAWNQERLQVRELECVITDLQKNYEKIENDNKTLSEELSTERTSFAELQYSKKNLEAQVQQLQESTEWQRKENERVRKLVEESNLLKAQLQEMEEYLQAKEKDALDAEVLKKENHEMEIQICQMVQQNVQLRRQLNDVTLTKDHLEQKNNVLHEEMEILKMESSGSRESTPPQIQCIQQEDEEEEEDEDHTVDYTYDEDDDDNKFKMQILPSEDHLTRTPPAFSLAEEVEYSIFDAYSPGEDKVEQPPSKPSDALEEYVHLTVAAVKIRFNLLPIPKDKLMQLAKKHPFYKMHDELTKYMEKELLEQKSTPNKQKQVDDQKQELASVEKDEDQLSSASQVNTQPSVLKKVRNLFWQRSTTELQKKEIEST